jgi:hypothetical protein
MSWCNRCFNFKTLLCLLLGILAALFVVFFIIDITSPEPALSGIQAQQLDAEGTVIADGGNVIFDSLLNDQSDNISYNSATGEFTITEPGNYYVDWWVGTDGAGPGTNVTFAIEVNGVEYSDASSPIVSGQLSGEALVTVTTTPTIITLVNTSGNDVFVPTIPIQGNIVITEVAN